MPQKNKNIKKLVKENSFEGGVSGTSGILNYSTPYGTPGGGNITQNPAYFSPYEKTVNHMDNQQTDVLSNGKVFNNDNISGSIENKKSLNPTDSYEKDIEKIFKKKDVPTPDEIIAAMKYEMGKMVKRDKNLAKKIILKNLKQDPHYYSHLNMLNIDDKTMKVDENKTDSLKKMLDDMFVERQKRRNPAHSCIRQMLDELKQKRFESKRNIY